MVDVDLRPQWHVEAGIARIANDAADRVPRRVLPVAAQLDALSNRVRAWPSRPRERFVDQHERRMIGWRRVGQHRTLTHGNAKDAKVAGCDDAILRDQFAP